ncbi:MAG: hypothetical protein ABR548_08515 [Actinomycetota bacterium]|nr:hypothetical protein [Actinomycetota bacterium]
MKTYSVITPGSFSQLRRAAIVASIGAGAIHLGAAHVHFKEYAPAGAFMLLSGIAQLVWAFFLARRPSRSVVVAGVVANLGVIALWMISRTFGLPIGAESWVAEHIHATDALCTGLELVVALAGATLLRPSLAVPSGRLLGLATGGLVLSATVTSNDPVRERAVQTAAVMAAGALLAFLAAKQRYSRVRAARPRRSKVRALAATMLGVTIIFGPLSARAGEMPRTAHNDITISWDGELNRAHGVRSGHGTPRDPFVISGWTVNNINIKDTDKAIRIMDNSIPGTLTLNWVGSNIQVMNNDVGDLRVNENTPRWGDPTAGMITRNTFRQVGQLRHFDGMFAYNIVGAPQTGGLSSKYPDVQAVNFDGFNGAHFMKNTIYGFVDARLHGHHHSSAYGTASHMHADGPHDANMVDHTRRFHEVFIEANRIYTSHTYALMYVDTDHAGNDRTANSETNPYLNAPHTHFTRVHITSNQLFGAGILVNVFNAKDERHTGTPKGLVDIASNRVTLERDSVNPFKVVQGIEIDQARYLTLRIRSNVINGPAPLVDVAQLHSLQTQGAGIVLNQLDHAYVTITSDRVSERQFGVQAVQLSKSVTWVVKSLATTNVDQPVSYDASVANAPQR